MNLEMITNTGDVEYENIVCLTHYSKDDILSFSEEIKDKIEEWGNFLKRYLMR